MCVCCVVLCVCVLLFDVVSHSLSSARMSFHPMPVRVCLCACVRLLRAAAQLPATVTTAFVKRPLHASEALARGILDGTALPAATADVGDIEAAAVAVDVKQQVGLLVLLLLCFCVCVCMFGCVCMCVWVCECCGGCGWM